MAKNDTILLDGILDDRVTNKLPSEKRDEAFEYFATEQILKDYSLSKDEILIGSIDGRNDGGIDSFHIFVNGHLLTDPDLFFWPKTNAELEVSIITCKHHDTFRQAPIDNLVATISEIFDLSIDKKDLTGDYNEELIKRRELLKTAYRKVSPKLTSFRINYTYSSRGDSALVGESIVSRGNQLVKITEQSFGACTSSFNFIGSSELVELHRKTPSFSLDLPFIENLAKGERYVLLSRIEDYFHFVTDESGKLRRYLFDSNVRDFMGLNRVNEDIKLTLENVCSPDFWWLNNGVTILATTAICIGKTIHIEDIQIVNGLQTTESIYRYFSTGHVDTNERSILIKVIKSTEKEVRDSIIRATNNQTNVELSSLHATDKIQRDIEDILERYGLYYERRANHYSNQGILPNLIVTPLYLASGYVSLVLKSFSTASTLKSRFMRSVSSYQTVFSNKAPIDLWPKISLILKRTDLVLEKVRSLEHVRSEKFLKKWRYVVSYLTVSKILNKYDFNTIDLQNIDIEKYSEREVKLSWNFVNKLRNPTYEKSKTIPKAFILLAFKSFGDKFKITGFEALNSWQSRSGIVIYGTDTTNKEIILDKKFIERVNQALPEQPWKPKMHFKIANELRCSVEDVFAATNYLIEEGLRFYQKDGIIYDKNGKILKIDDDRVDSTTLKLKEIKE